MVDQSGDLKVCRDVLLEAFAEEVGQEAAGVGAAGLAAGLVLGGDDGEAGVRQAHHPPVPQMDEVLQGSSC